MNNIRLFQPSLGSKELNSVKKVFKRSWIGYGTEVQKFEAEWNKHFGVKHSIAVNSCTAALHLALLCNNFKKGKKVLVPAITFSATAAVVLYCGLIPVFVDINKNDLNMSLDDLKKKFTKDCVAIMPVHFGGHPCEMDRIMKFANQKKLIVIEDCAETCGGYYKGKKIGTWGHFGCFSFEEKKMMTTGDGGMIVTNNTHIAKKLKSLSFHGWDKDPLLRHKQRFSNNKKKNKQNLHWYYEINQLGFKYNMNDLEASIGRVQLKKLSFLNNSRIKFLKKYLKNLKKCKNLIPTFPYDLNKSSYWMFSIRSKNRDKLISYLKKHNISTSVHLMPLPLHPLYKKFKSKIPIALKVWKELVTLPLHPHLKNKEISFINSKLREFKL
ncbi:UDP-4-amino-4-deoxy-L-arabinose--oxoglutarate aminotransferase (UDP-(beta-L-threo-pentapyranosyl-4''-ulose diphosphate)aminotransferase), putative [Candidatus Pelagibacter sp. HTCC7211]|uniref:DegT/DnrJ/EryC1/StrS family aminotransferase n=1 Tax=Pelagibacter sp. (strain HTCC7211) TaxID=439493 RepID=UPI000183A1E3|nr:DegT/DnrJ/EryC1/StrS aminotransferase family protein [Candidatus Pelagibacter sp. HTCC7211]EDZ61025.1 UDP-4-amino-4-deoxy-L-arabinose--oxoglutarate aminotransferase (UDP-(beta-L-threo-pentapyranosyl-4''-ulose diphosphate)aminotransferase), putative [Candidatus Pelagibacter sp. HTCC7211]MBD1151136.1 DegT/DnrJ/EryC1/StrS aminotransferase family protein [Pelagibacterales bacterium SAG-MED25]